MSQILTPGERPDVWGIIGDLKRRVAILEAVRPDAGGCSPYTPWSDWGSTALEISLASTGGCATSNPPNATFAGLVWACGTSDPNDATSMVTGSVTIKMSDGGYVDASACDPGELLAYYYSFLPPFWQGGESMGSGMNRDAPFGFGITYDAATHTVLPAWLTYDPAGDGWVVKVAGTDTSGIATNNLARPLIQDALPAYPFDYDNGGGQSLLFQGTFLYFVQGE